MLNLKILWVKVTTNTLPSENIPSVYSTSQRINAALGTVAGNNTSVPLDHELPSGPSGQICHFSWLLGWPQLIIPALCGARRCQEMSQGAPCPSLTPLSAGRCFSLVWVFFLYLFTNTTVYPFQPFSGEAEPDVLLSLSCGCVTERGSVLLISEPLNLAIIVFQTRLCAIFGIFSYLVCLEGSWIMQYLKIW